MIPSEIKLFIQKTTNMKSILSPLAVTISFSMFALSFHMAVQVPDMHDKMGLLMIMSFSAMLVMFLIMLEEKSRFFIWIEGIGAVLWIGAAIFFGIHYFQMI